MEKHICIIGILVNERSENAPKVQQVLSKCGSLILHRSGIPYANDSRGIINLTLEVTGTEMDAITKELRDIEGTIVQSMVLADDAAKLSS